MKPIVAIVGRPNVGKSTFFNKIVGRRISIVEDTPGVTRDRIAAEAEWNGRDFLLIDTGGIEPDAKDFILSKMRIQAEIAMDTANVILFLVDGRAGVTAADSDVATLLRRKGKDVILVANKIDTANLPDGFYDFYEFGLGHPFPISSTNQLGLGDLLDAIVEKFPAEADAPDDGDSVHIAIIGKPNVGKSSMVNAILGEERVIVSEEAGTTRDSIDTPFVKDGVRYVLIDTAGIRRRSRVSDDIEKYSVIRALSAIERCDVALLVIDAQDGVTEQDKKIAGLAHEAGKGIIVVVNKWDLIPRETNTMRDYARTVKQELQFMHYAPVLFTSVKKGQRLESVLQTATAVSEMRAMRVSTGQLNSLIADAMLMNNPPSDKGRRLKIYYAAQIGVKPPLFSFQVNDRELMHFSYARYLENKIRDGYGFEGTSIKFVFREKKDRENG
ncbi:MAG: ribosome biogenesis GTPase Der [Bacillota bacterium]|jgi:GTP-binding protein|nr:ribosome biogenesis GTPase Der [Eubacteriales bacterium]MDI9491915.1 ribosome biogenesis GTPase Der [Bacillota bacterium]NLV70442.1 ribosome biogenesis GTPase Der [Clostridiales bacterium]HRV33386.1 ribosome biogenesis GTPase Der [Anaerovoracaceae bacterium]MDD3537151.1 ribosome biogenesis GTPase Der [Eubacteriales bacterium]